MNSNRVSRPFVDATSRMPRLPGGLAASGAVLAAAAVALAAYASHAVDGEQQARLQLAAVFAFGHGLGLAALSPRAVTRLAMAALIAMLIGSLLFAGSLAAAHFLGTPTRLAPLGGGLLLLAWLLHAVDAVRR